MLDFDGLVGEPGELAGSHAEGVVEYLEEKEQMMLRHETSRFQEEYAVEGAFPGQLAPHLLAVSRVPPARFQREPVPLSQLLLQMADQAVEPGFLRFEAPRTVGCTEPLSRLTDLV